MVPLKRGHVNNFRGVPLAQILEVSLISLKATFRAAQKNSCKWGEITPLMGEIT